MPHATVVLLGNLPVETLPIEVVAAEFGWSVESAVDLGHLRKLARSHNLVAVLFHPDGFGLTHSQIMNAVRDSAPSARCIPCHRFSDRVNWPDLAEAGAFHALALPLKLNEVRQSLGFVWSARLAQTAKILPMRSAENREDLENREENVPSAQLRDAS